MQTTGEILNYAMEQAEADRLNAEAWSLRTSDHKTALHLSETAERISSRSCYTPGIARSKRNIGYFSFKQGAYERAILSSNEALKLFRQLNDQAGEADSLYTLAITHLNLGDNSLALEELLQALAIRQQLGDIAGESEILNNIGHIYLKFEDNASALEYYNRALDIARQTGNKPGEGYALMNIASVLIEEKEFAEALEYCEQSLKARIEGGDQHGTFVTRYRIASIYSETGRYEESLGTFNEVIEAAAELGEKMGLARTFESVGKIHQKLEQYEEAENAFKKAMDLATEIGSREHMYELHHCFAQLYEATGDIRKALEHFKLFQQKKQDAWKTDSERILSNVRTAHKAESAEKEAEIHRLRNVELAEALQMINDSISYAQRIQSAVLPDERLLNTILPDSFVFYRPRNVVSGDFYWLSGNADKYFFAVADCTGHGVPGAFMSLICSSILTQLTKEFPGADPSQLLAEADRRVCEALRQHDTLSRTHDGMDISICYVDRKAKKLLFSSAHRPLVLIRNGEMKLWKGDKYPIGGTQLTDKSFTCHNIDIQEGDILYMYTDGYADQFGGKNNKKFSTRQLLQSILTNHSMPFVSQMAFFTEAFESWKGPNEQIDDVTLAGFRPL